MPTDIIQLPHFSTSKDQVLIQMSHLKSRSLEGMGRKGRGSENAFFDFS